MKRCCMCGEVVDGTDRCENLCAKHKECCAGYGKCAHTKPITMTVGA